MSGTESSFEKLPAGIRRDAARGVVAAVSGGPDSIALLHILLESGVPAERIVAAHLDHGLRPESRHDAAFVRALSREAGVRCVNDALPPGVLAREPGGSVEAAARRARYAFLERVARDEARPFVMTGHHLEDQAETVLLRVLRGTGPTGLRGIHARRPIRPTSEIILLRPLLPVRRADVLRFLAARGIGFRTDPTNLDGSNLRSLLRARLLPHLREAVPDLDRRLAALVPPAERLVAHADAEASDDPAGTDPRPSVLRARILASLPDSGPPVDRAAVDRVLALLPKGEGATDLGAGYLLRVSGGRMNVRPGEEPDHPGTDTAHLACPGETVLPDGRRLIARSEDEAAPGGGASREVIDRDRASPPWSVRLARAGDRFRPLGLGAETTVFRFLMGRGVPREERGRTPVVLSGDRLVWVVGHRIDERARIDGGTRRRAVLTVEPRA